MDKRFKELYRQAPSEFQKEYINRWITNYLELSTFYKQYGHSRVTDVINHETLYKWVVSQRFRKKMGRITALQEDLLNEIEFVWVIVPKRKYPDKIIPWEERIKSLTRLLETINAEDFLANISTISDPLGKWVLSQRSKWRRGLMSSTHDEQLKKLLGEKWFDFGNESNRNWYINYNLLKDYHQQYGNCDVEKNYDKTHSLVMWVNRQKFRFNREGLNTLSDKQKKLLDAIEFSNIVTPKRDYDQLWNDTYKRLKAYVKKLETLGFEFQVIMDPASITAWYKKYEQYQEHLQKYGVEGIAKKSPKGSSGKSLYDWRTKQRTRCRMGYPFTKDQLQKMENIGVLDGIEVVYPSVKVVYQERGGFFNSKTGVNTRMKQYEDLWEQRYEELKKYKEVYNHCVVTIRQDQYRSLGFWVKTQRDNQRKGILSPEREKRLNELGFTWSTILPKKINKYIEVSR